ncbi:MAG: hypothetical protein R3D34_04830 [Nitratireductor sp.]
MNPAIMASVAAAALYAAIFALMGIWLIVIVSQWRQREKVSIGDGGKINLIRRCVVVPISSRRFRWSLILLLAMALLGAPYWVIHLFGAPWSLPESCMACIFPNPASPWMAARGRSRHQRPGNNLRPLAWPAMRSTS